MIEEQNHQLQQQLDLRQKEIKELEEETTTKTEQWKTLQSNV